MITKKFLQDDLLRSVDLGYPIDISKVFKYLTSHEAENLFWYKDISVLSHIANVVYFANIIAEKIKGNGIIVDRKKVILYGWLRDIGRVSWGLAQECKYSELMHKYGHHGYLGYCLLKKSNVNDDLAKITMTHIGSGITAAEADEINTILKKDVFPVRDWYAKTVEEMIVVIADKIPGWNNTIIKPWKTNQMQDISGISINERSGNKIYSWLPNQTPLWNRFWDFKKKVDNACECDCLTLFDKGLFDSDPESFYRLPSPEIIAQIV